MTPLPQHEFRLELRLTFRRTSEKVPSLYSRGPRGLSDARDATGCHRLAAAQPVAAAQLVRVPCGGPLLHLPQPLDAGEHEVDLRARREGVTEQLRVERAMRVVRP